MYPSRTQDTLAQSQPCTLSRDPLPSLLLPREDFLAAKMIQLFTAGRFFDEDENGFDSRKAVALNLVKDKLSRV